MTTGIGRQLKACGRKKLPRVIEVAHKNYRLARIFKHDFFAATAMYEFIGPDKSDNASSAKAVILKMSRQGDFLGLPLGWLGEFIREHEISILRRLQGIGGTPRLLGRYGKTGLIYEYISGKSLAEGVQAPDDFFDQLEELLSKIHALDIAYVDFNKRGNILLGSDNQAYLIDYQISIHIGRLWQWFFGPAGYLLKVLQREDVYHLFKHKRRFRRDLMDEEQLRRSRRISKWVALHRALARPITTIRRYCLGYLYRKNQLMIDKTMETHAETDPSRWNK